MLIIEDHKSSSPWGLLSFDSKTCNASHLSPVNVAFLKSLGYDVSVKVNGPTRVRRQRKKARVSQVLSANKIFRLQSYCGDCNQSARGLYALFRIKSGI